MHNEIRRGTRPNQKFCLAFFPSKLGAKGVDWKQRLILANSFPKKSFPDHSMDRTALHLPIYYYSVFSLRVWALSTLLTINSPEQASDLNYEREGGAGERRGNGPGAEGDGKGKQK